MQLWSNTIFVVAIVDTKCCHCAAKAEPVDRLPLKFLSGEHNLHEHR